MGVDRPPEIHPARTVEFRLVSEVEAQSFRRCRQSQHEPALLLPDAEWRAVPAYVFVREPVAQPIAGNAEQFDIRFLEADFLAQFAVHRLPGVFAPQHTALRELPSLATDPTANHQLATVIREDDSDIGAESLIIDPVAIHRNRIKLFNCR